MAYFVIEEPNKKRKYIKSVDGANGTLTFQSDSYGAFHKNSGIIADSTEDYLKFHFMEKYPELKYLKQSY